MDRNKLTKDQIAGGCDKFEENLVRQIEAAEDAKVEAQKSLDEAENTLLICRQNLADFHEVFMETEPERKPTPKKTAPKVQEKKEEVEVEVEDEKEDDDPF